MVLDAERTYALGHLLFAILDHVYISYRSHFLDGNLAVKGADFATAFFFSVDDIFLALQDDKAVAHHGTLVALDVHFFERLSERLSDEARGHY